MQYNYDTHGAIFSYFVLTLLVIVLFPTTFYYLSKSELVHVIKCQCDQCKIKNKRTKGKKKSGFKGILLLIGWIVFGFVLYRSFTLVDKEPELWDPYRILGVETDADDSAVKKAHPDKVQAKIKEGDDKEKIMKEAEEKFVDISKAYKVLTDEEARKLFDEFGHPDGKQAFQLGLALPSWLVEKSNSSLVLLVYTLAFGIGLPVMVARWWRNAKVTSKNQVLSETMGIFYRDVKDSLGFKGLLDIVIKAQEYQELFKDSTVKGFPDYELQVTEKISGVIDYKAVKKSTQLSMASKRALLLLLAHVYRQEPKNAELAALQFEVVEIASKLVSGLMQIAVSRNWIRVSLNIIEFGQLLTQAIPPHQSQLLQLPLSQEHIKLLASKKPKIETVADIRKTSANELKDILSLNDSKIQLIKSVADQYPRIHLVKAEYSVYGEPLIVPSSLVTLSVKFRCLFGDETYKGDDKILDPEEEKKQKQWWVSKSVDDSVAHAPYFPAIKKPSFYVILANYSIGRLICIAKVQGTQQDHTVRLQFQSPPEPGQWTFQVYIKSDTFYGIDHHFDLQLVVKPADSLPPMEEFGDISEPGDESSDEEVEKKKKVKKEKKVLEEYEDSDDTDDDQDDDDSGPDSDFVE
ncbi:secretory subunit [Boothiomyces sp. JEL0838]|nr:secretory subunit [Boothiomyces sp. JEL0838]